MITPELQIKNVRDFIEMSFLKYGGSPFPITTDHLKMLLTMPTCSNASCSCRLTAGDVFIDLNERYSISPASFGD
jgi:hypothetical protein